MAPVLVLAPGSALACGRTVHHLKEGQHAQKRDSLENHRDFDKWLDPGPNDWLESQLCQAYTLLLFFVLKQMTTISIS